MKIAPILTEKQDDFFEDVFVNIPLILEGQRRQFFGVTMEEIIKRMLFLDDVKKSGNYDICPDAYDPYSDSYIEIKSLKRGASMTIYKFRIEKDKKVDNLTYVIGVHNVQRGCPSSLDVYNGISSTMNMIIISSKEKIEKLAKREKLRKIKSERKTRSGKRNGYTRVGYNEGYYNIPFSKLSKNLFLCGTASSEYKGFLFSSMIYTVN